MSEGKSYRYRWCKAKISWSIVLIMCVLSCALFFYMVLEREFGLISKVAHERLVRGMPMYPILFGMVSSAIGLLGAFIKFWSFTGKISIGVPSVSFTTLFRSVSIQWHDTSTLVIARHLNPGAYDTSNVRETLKIISAQGARILIHQEVEHFGEVKAKILRECELRSVPIYFQKDGEREPTSIRRYEG